MVKTASHPIPAVAGIGLRSEHYRCVLDRKPDIGWLEVHTENYFGSGGAPHHYLGKIRAHYPVSFHGVGLSLGSVDPFDRAHVARIRQLIERYQPTLVSEHLSWSSVGRVFMNDLLPLPYTEEALALVVDKVSQLQDLLGRRILIENPSTYVCFRHSTIAEVDFLVEAARQSDCGILLDVNNVYVSAVNHGFDAAQYLAAVPAELVEEIHLAGHTVREFATNTLLIDTHNDTVCAAVWALYAAVIERIGRRPTLIEWDSDLPELDTLLQQASMAQSIMHGDALPTAVDRQQGNAYAA